MNKLFALLLGLLLTASPAHAVLSEVYSDAAWKNLADFTTNAAASEATKALKAVDTSADALKAASSSKALSRLRFADKFKKLSIVYKVGTSYGMVDLNGAEILDFIRIIDHLCEGQWQDAGNQGFDTLLGYFVPAYGQYMALHGMVKTSVTAVVGNWTESLYETKAYRSVVDLMNQTILERAKRKLPFIPTILIRDTPVDDATLTNMASIENEMYVSWMANSPDIELGTGSNPSRLRQVLGHDPANDREIFDLFYQKAVGDQLGYIQVTYQRVAKQAAEEARKKFYEQTVRELNAFMDRNARPENVEIAYAAGKLTVSFDGMPGYAYKTGVYLYNSENRESEDKRIYYETVIGTEARNSVSFPFTLTDKKFDSIQTIIADKFGRSRGAEISLSPAAVKIGKINQTFDDYGGRPVDGNVQNGEIIAFQSHVQLPAFEKKTLTTLTWQVYRADTSPVSGLTKTMSILEAGTQKDMRFRFRLDAMAEGDYYTQLSVCPQGKACRSETSPFTVSQRIAVTALNFSTDRAETRLSNGIFKNNDTAYAFAHYETSADKVTVRLTVRDKNSGKVVQSLEGEKTVDKTKADKRAGLLLDLNRLKIATPYEITAAFSTPDGKSAVKTAGFSKGYYGLDISPYLDLKAGESRNFSVALEKGLTPPLTLNVSSSNGAAIASSSGRTPAFRIVNPSAGVMKLKVTVRGANGGIAEKSYDTYVSAKPKPAPKPLLAEEVPITSYKPKPAQTSDARIFYVGVYVKRSQLTNNRKKDRRCFYQESPSFGRYTTYSTHVLEKTAGPMTESEAKKYCHQYKLRD